MTTVSLKNSNMISTITVLEYLDLPTSEQIVVTGSDRKVNQTHRTVSRKQKVFQTHAQRKTFKTSLVVYFLISKEKNHNSHFTTIA